MPAVLDQSWAVGSGDKEEFDISAFSAKQLEANELVKKFCTGCHTESRIINGLRSFHKDYGIAYGDQVKVTVVKKIRLTGGNIPRQDGKKIIEFLGSL